MGVPFPSSAKPVADLPYNLRCALADDLGRHVVEVGEGLALPPSPAAAPGRYAVDRPVASPLDRPVLEELAAELAGHEAKGAIPPRVLLTLRALLGDPAGTAAAASDLVENPQTLDGEILALMLMTAQQWAEMDEPARIAMEVKAPPSARKAAVEALVHWGETKTAADLAAFAAHSDPEIRPRAAQILSWCNRPPVPTGKGCWQDIALPPIDSHTVRGLISAGLPSQDAVRLGYRWLCREPESVGAHVELAEFLALDSPEAAAYHQTEARCLSRAMLQKPNPVLSLDIDPAIRAWRLRYARENPQTLSWQTPGRPLVNLRISACGSWSFSEMLKRLSPTDNDLDFSDHSDLDRRLPALDPKRIGRGQIFQIHVPLAFHRLLPGRSRYVTQIRNPIARILSLFYWHYNNRYESWVPDYYRNGITLRRWLEDHCENDLCLWFLMTDHPIPRPFEYHGLRHRLQGIPAMELAEMALDAARRNFDFVGITELFSESMFIFGLAMKCDSLPLWNHLGSSGAPKPEDIHPEIIDMIKTRHAADILFYNAMRDEFERSHAESISFFRHHIGSLEDKQAPKLIRNLIDSQATVSH
ncbi:hypothetical protein [Azospirillum sp.]|uniref:hypothetical protein n=1 Tax=Azospirillum sp. TaxID=34012 RepID=UPI0026220A6E|nr:hypothetical protein [Azospirillum sp.]